ncbi:unnamed protein product [Kuraishia capsulata CBS 1993]|uniref:WW domain-containing protein n=1 Tax=Kuraishia capsulata CBS 1993 TaxID=1382522 RepID=W6MUN8_9ASCO|nr:uncharacterized protein KUCA_T00005425001 [Kuraishia capsulata CBS 1993]CDK29437.1 unnamed protein product [Kuraishia capsulata CBS 1993]
MTDNKSTHIDQSPVLPRGWVSKVDEQTKRLYYLNTITGQAQLEFPTTESSDYDVDDLPPQYEDAVAGSAPQEGRSSEPKGRVHRAAIIADQFQKRAFDYETRHSGTHVLSQHFQKHKQKRESEGVDPNSTSSKLISTGAAVTSFILDQRRARFERRRRFGITGLITRAFDPNDTENDERYDSIRYGRRGKH